MLVFPVRASDIPANTGHLPNVDWMLGQRLRRWPNIQTTLGESPVYVTDPLSVDTW